MYKIEAPFGFLYAEITSVGISKLSTNPIEIDNSFSDEKSVQIFGELKNQLRAYFENERKTFELPLNPQGTEFQKSVWKELEKIEFGKVITYKEQSIRMRNPKGIRAIASANGKNPIMILIPCHRVIGSDGSLTGYAGGIQNKAWLLNHESGQQSLF